MIKKTFSIKGMSCNSCATAIELELENKVSSINVDFASEKAEIEFDPKKISEKQIRDIINKLGYNVK